MAKLPARVVETQNAKVLAAIRDGTTLRQAVEIAGTDRGTWWCRCQADPDLQAAYEDALIARNQADQEIVRRVAIQRVTDGAVEETYAIDEDGEERLKVRRIVRSPADVANAARITGLMVNDKLEVAHSGEVASPDVAAAIDRFTALTAAAIRQAARDTTAEPPELTDGS